VPGIAHEGYTAGVIAAALGDGDAEVQLRRPVPTGRALALERGRGPRVLLADAVAAHVPLDVPPPVTQADANAAATRFPGFRRHAFPDCFCCGPVNESLVRVNLSVRIA